jgi:hypothetical protein
MTCGEPRTHRHRASSEENLAPGHVVVSAAVTLGFAIAHD